MITQFHAGHAKRAVAQLCGFTPYTHNDGGTLVIGCGHGSQSVERAECVKLLCRVPNTTVSIDRSERLGSFAQQEAWEAAGENFSTYLCIRRF